jgi:hypothetical protein
MSPLYAPDSSPGGLYLQKFQHDGRGVGLETANRGKNTRTWLLFPTLRLPMLVETLKDDELAVAVAPEDELAVRGTVMGLDEIHLIQAARLYRNANNELVRVTFGSNYTDDPDDLNPNDNTEDILARNVVGLHFIYNPESRLLTMFIATRGQEEDGLNKASGPLWPSLLPPIDSAHLGYRISTKSLTWRIRN